MKDKDMVKVEEDFFKNHSEFKYVHFPIHGTHLGDANKMWPIIRKPLAKLYKFWNPDKLHKLIPQI